jgi:hypothetical protein
VTEVAVLQGQRGELKLETLSWKPLEWAVANNWKGESHGRDIGENNESN